jgi:molybdopterin-binding protein
MKLSARNTLPGKITELQLGGVMAHVVAEEQKSRRAEEQKSRRAEEQKR